MSHNCSPIAPHSMLAAFEEQALGFCLANGLDAVKEPIKVRICPQATVQIPGVLDKKPDQLGLIYMPFLHERGALHSGISLERWGTSLIWVALVVIGVYLLPRIFWDVARRWVVWAASRDPRLKSILKA